MADSAFAPLRWSDLYREVELHKAALRLYTKPLFQWRKALVTSWDGHTLYDFARHGLRNLSDLHQALERQKFAFRPGLALERNFNGKHRTLYIFPWQERLVDLLLYRLLNRALNPWLSSASYAYRLGGFGVDRCQRHIQRALRRLGDPVYVMKRDLADYFASIDHEMLFDKLNTILTPGDYLQDLLRQRVQFAYHQDDTVRQATRGVPFGTASACLLANLYLADLDRRLESLPELVYVRYADDFLLVTQRRTTLDAAQDVFDQELARLRLASKPSHALDFVFTGCRDGQLDSNPVLVAGTATSRAPDLPRASRFRHLGLEYRVGGSVGLSRDKFRKICNLFRYAFRRRRGKFRRLREPLARARLAVALAQRVIADGVRNVAIIDYYLRHVTDEDQLRRLDRWLAEEVLALACGGHRKGNFRILPYRRLRELGLPSLVHRRRLLRHGHLASSFFIWKNCQASKNGKPRDGRPWAFREPTGDPGPVARSAAPSVPAFSQGPEAAADASS